MNIELFTNYEPKTTEKNLRELPNDPCKSVITEIYRYKKDWRQ